MDQATNGFRIHKQSSNVATYLQQKINSMLDFLDFFIAPAIGPKHPEHKPYQPSKNSGGFRRLRTHSEAGPAEKNGGH